jgi:membrane-associated phospholipid phosphatase
MDPAPRLRSSEWFLCGYFIYVAIVASWFFAPWKAWAVACAVVVVVLAAARMRPVWRDWAPLPLMLAAYREMNWFTPALYDHRLERVWIVWDRWLLDAHHLRAIIESAGPLFPAFLEICYVLVYAVAPVSVVLILLNGRRAEIDRFWLAYLVGTLGAYALFPYFPSEPPRIAFAGADLPRLVTLARRVNLWILGGYGIHSSVFPSAHVSSAFSAAWALLVIIPGKRWIGALMACYAASVAVATIYGRYHYAADVLAGIAVSLLALAALHHSWRRARIGSMREARRAGR